MGHRILLADDSLTIQKVVELTFSETEYELMAVGSGDRAVEALDEFRPDVVLADVVMPGLTGYEVCERVKSRPDGAAIPVVLLTGTFEPFDRARAERAGCDSIVTKPFDAHALAALVERLIVKGAEIRAQLAAAPPPPPSMPEPPAVSLPPDPFGDTVAYRPVEPVSSATAVPEDIFSPQVAQPEPEAPMVAPAPMVAEAPVVPEAPMFLDPPVVPEPAIVPGPVAVAARPDEDTHPLLVIVPPPPPEPEEFLDSQSGADVQPRDIERDLEAFEQTGQGRSRPEVWEQAEALGVISRVETSGEHTAVERVHPEAAANGELEALAAQARMTDLSELIPISREQAAASSAAAPLSDAEVERIARRVIQIIGEKFIRDIAWEVVPETANRIVRDRLAEIEKG